MPARQQGKAYHPFLLSLLSVAVLSVSGPVSSGLPAWLCQIEPDALLVTSQPASADQFVFQTAAA